jgi:hypothetical protein
MKEVQLSRGYVALVDDDDFEWLSQYRWHASDKGAGYFYAARIITKDDGKRTLEYMHRAIKQNPKGFFVDHKDGNTFNNQKSNLRVCTRAENIRNEGKQKHNTSGYCGVRPSGSKFVAHITVNNKNIYIGTCDTKEEAARAYDAAALKYHGEFARLNFPKEQPQQKAY